MRSFVMAICVFLSVFIFLTAPTFSADLNLAWDPSDGTTGYRVQISTDLEATWGETRDAGSNTTFTWTGAPDDKLILFRAIAYNAQGEAVNYTKGAWYNGTWNPPASAKGLGLK